MRFRFEPQFVWFLYDVLPIFFVVANNNRPSRSLSDSFPARFKRIVTKNRFREQLVKKDNDLVRICSLSPPSLSLSPSLSRYRLYLCFTPIFSFVFALPRLKISARDRC